MSSSWMVRRSRSSPGGFRSVTVRFACGARRAAVFLAAVLGLPATLALAALVTLRALLAFLPDRLAVSGRLALLAFAALRVRATAAVFFRAAFFRAALFLADFLAREFARADLFFLVAAALRLAIALVLSATGLP